MNKMTNYTKSLCNRHLQNTLDNYNFECDGRSDTNKIYYSVKNGIDQTHLITFDEQKKEVKNELVNLDDIFNFSEVILSSLEVYL